PWSKVRKRKTAFYARIQAMVAEIADLPSIKVALQEVSRLLHCPVALVGGARPILATTAGDTETINLAQFPNETLEQIKSIVVANEIAEAMPAMHAMMKR